MPVVLMVIASMSSIPISFSWLFNDAACGQREQSQKDTQFGKSIPVHDECFRKELVNHYLKFTPVAR
jgi:hypothetical protein